MMAEHTRIEWTDVLAAIDAAGWQIVPKTATARMYMPGGNTPVSNRGKDHIPHRCDRRIGDLAAAEAYAVMLSYAPTPPFGARDA
jgi:hypothetical protein